MKRGVALGALVVACALPVISVISANPLPPGYLRYLRYKLESYVSRNQTSN